MSNGNKMIRMSVPVDEETHQRIRYWAEKKGLSLSEYVREAIDMMIAYENGDYDLPTLEAQRLNQIIDALTVLSDNQASMERMMQSGFDSLLGLTRGDNYLLEDDSGDLWE